MKVFVLLIFLELISHLYAPIIKANTPLLIDQFERDNIYPWQVVQNEGSGNWRHCLDVLSPAKWQIENGWIQLVVDGISCTLAISPQEKNLITSQNWQVDFDWRLEESINMDRNFVWWWQDKENWYDVKLYGTGINVQKVIDGQAQELVNSHTTYPFQANGIYHFTIKYQNSYIKISIDGQEIISSFDPNPLNSTEKTIALKTSLGSRRSASSFDNLQVFSLPSSNSNELGVPLLKQTDPKWSNLEYDTAKFWSDNPTMERWGCAITATAMIMRFHQLTFLPNGQEITPSSLNHWLLSQPDGYIGNGLLNWLAISRLSAEINKQYGTPKLEYQRISGSNLEQQANALERNLPLIFNIEGHFLVATGYNSQNQDFSILDPFYFYRKFSQHQKELLSSRLFTPSYTDLSYLMFVTNTNVDLNIISEQESHLEVEKFIEKTIDPISSQETSVKIIQLKKPKSDNYRFEVSNPSGEDQTVDYYGYNASGEYITDNFTIEKNNYKSGQLIFNPNSQILTPPVITSTNQSNTTWTEIVELLSTHYSLPSGKYWPIFEYLLTLTNHISESDISAQISLRQKLIEVVTRTPLPTEVSTNLLQSLNSLNLVI